MFADFFDNSGSLERELTSWDKDQNCRKEYGWLNAIMVRISMYKFQH